MPAQRHRAECKSPVASLTARRFWSARDTSQRGEGLTLADICSTETRNVSNEAHTEMVVEETEAAPDYGLGIKGPGEAYARGEVVLLVERRIIVPAEAGVDRQIVPYLPVILNPKAVVIVAQLDLIGLWSKAADGGQEEKPGVDRAELHVVGLC